MQDRSSDISYFAYTNARSRYTRFGIRQADQLSHMYVIGATGVGKSTLLGALARQDLDAGRGFALIDPHGDLVERMAQAAAKTRRTVVYLNAPDSSQSFGYNPLRRVRDDKMPLAASGLLEALKKLWPDARASAWSMCSAMPCMLYSKGKALLCPISYGCSPKMNTVLASFQSSAKRPSGGSG
jgi:hypothetical protein